MDTVLLVIHLMVAVALISVILIQRTAQDGGGLMGGGSTMGGLFTARGSANLLTRTTAVLATIFICTSLALGYIASSHHQTRSLIDQIAPVAPSEAPAAASSPAPTPTPAPEVPAGQAPTPSVPPASSNRVPTLPAPEVPAAPPQVPVAQ